MPSNVNDKGFLDIINNKFLRNNVQNTLEHTIYMIHSAESLDKGRPMSYNYKIAIVHIGSIVEAMLQDLLERQPQKQIQEFSWGWKYKNINNLYEKKDGTQIISGERHKKHFKMTSGTPFKQIIDLSEHLGILNNKLAEDCHKVRESRNKIHLHGIQKREKLFIKEDVNDILKVLAMVRHSISKFNN